MDQFTIKEIQDYRDETPGCSHCMHFNSAGASLMPFAVINSIRDHIELEGNIGGYEAAYERSEQISEFYDVTADLLNCRPRNIAYAANATDAYTRALSSVQFNPGDTILTTNEDYISNQIAFLSLQKRMGIKLVRTKSIPAGGVDLDDLEYQMKLHHPRLLAITHIPTNSGLVQPVVEIGQISAKYETIYLLDACQSIGQLEVDINKVNCDFLSTTSRKFLRGPRGAGFLYVSDKALSSGLEPLYIDMRGAEWIEKDQYKPRMDATRFEDWEFAYALLLGTKEAIKYAQQVGLLRIHQRLNEISAYFRDQLANIPGIRLLDKGSQLGAIITIELLEHRIDHIVHELLRKRVNVVTSYRNYAVIDFDEKEVREAIRISPHYFNTTDEIDEFTKLLKNLLSK